VSRIASRDPSASPLHVRLSRSDLLWVANTAHGPGGHWHARVRGGEPDHDHLATPEAAVRYLVDHRVPVPPELPDAESLADLRTVRAVVRHRLAPAGDAWTAEARVLLATARYAVSPEGRLSAVAQGWRGFCDELLLPLLALIAEGTPLRRCANPACRLLFEDGSRNHTRRWCDAAGCGNRDRVRRARGAPPGRLEPHARPDDRGSGATVPPGFGSFATGNPPRGSPA
jgi:hypothetical protein